MCKISNNILNLNNNILCPQQHSLLVKILICHWLETKPWPHLEATIYEREFLSLEANYFQVLIIFFGSISADLLLK